MTPWQFGIAITVAAEERKHSHELRAWHAWHTAAFQRCNKLPKLSEFLGTSKDDVSSRLKATLKASFPSKKGK